MLIVGFLGSVVFVVAVTVMLFGTWRTRAVVAAICGLGVLLVGLLWWAFILVLDDDYCPTQDSTTADLNWSILPPGPTCTWTVEVNGFDRHSGPTLVMSAWLVTLVAFGVVIRWCIRNHQSLQSRDEATPPRRSPAVEVGSVGDGEAAAEPPLSVSE